MSHMVIYRTADGQPGYHQTDEMDEAIKYVERLRNGDGVDGARIFRLEEVLMWMSRVSSTFIRFYFVTSR